MMIIPLLLLHHLEADHPKISLEEVEKKKRDGDLGEMQPAKL